jgi:mono/diheme cytochrome c family protein
VDLTPRAAAAKKTEVVSAKEGQRLATMFGCVACHSVTDTAMTNVGPKWKGLFGSTRDIVTEQGKKATVTADKAYLRESILEPNAKKLATYLKSEFAMPSLRRRADRRPDRVDRPLYPDPEVTCPPRSTSPAPPRPTHWRSTAIAMAFTPST